MTLVNLINYSATLSSPPPGSINVLVGQKVEGPGGDWIPCATKMADGTSILVCFKSGRESGKSAQQACRCAAQTRPFRAR